jgi:hypothetical protein
MYVSVTASIYTTRNLYLNCRGAGTQVSIPGYSLSPLHDVIIGPCDEWFGMLLLGLNAAGPATASADSSAGAHKSRSDGSTVPALGQGSWHLGQDRYPAALEVEALCTGFSLGMTLIDTSGNYGEGRSMN